MVVCMGLVVVFVAVFHLFPFFFVEDDDEVRQVPLWSGNCCVAVVDNSFDVEDDDEVVQVPVLFGLMFVLVPNLNFFLFFFLC